MNYFISNREVISKGRKEFLNESGEEYAGDNLRFGTYDIKSRTFELFKEPKTEKDLLYSGIKDKNSKLLKGSGRFFKEIYCNLIDEDKTGDVLFFIHGFNTDLDGVRKNFETLQEKYVDNPNSPIEHIVIFTWPGMAKKIPYHYHDDKKDAIRSGEALARGIVKLMNFFDSFLYKDGNEPCKQKFHLMLHSMGNRVFEHCILEMKRCKREIPEIFTEIILLAADVRYTIFEEEEAFYDLIDFGSRVSIFYHKKDTVLDISKYTKNFSNRLGRHGRRIKTPGLAEVYDIDVSHTNDDKEAGFREDKLNHWYYYSSKEVVKMITDILTGK